MPSPSQGLPDLEALLEYVKRSCGFDFTGYKRTSLTRRIKTRMEAAKIESFAVYRDHLEANRAEFEQLFDTILINVTGFFRDQATWSYLRQEVVPRLVAQKDPEGPIRVWSTGCATGEEAYTLAIALAETLGPEQFRERVKIYATDVDEAALTAARQASYPARAVADLPVGIVDKYFRQVDSDFVFRKDLRRSVVFGRNDLILDAPISRIDLLSCRNTIMYFDTPTQSRIVGRFHFALNDGGYLVLGKAETLVAHSSMFTPVDPTRRIFQKASRARSPMRLRGAPGVALDEGPGAVERRETALRAGSQRQLHTNPPTSENELQAAQKELQLAKEQLETTAEELRSTVEELETTNQVLQSTNEELETMNEELQSTNEELQTMNEELRLRRDELNQANGFVEQVLTSLRYGVAVVDRDLKVRVWNRNAEDLWGVRADEAASAHFLELDIGLPVDQLWQPIRAALVRRDGALQEVVLPAVCRRGKTIDCRVVCAPLLGRDGRDPQGVIVIMEEVPAA